VCEVPYIDAAQALRSACPHHAAPHGAQRHRLVPDAALGLRRPAGPRRGVNVLSGARCAGAGAGLGGLILQGGAEEYATTAPWIAVFCEGGHHARRQPVQ
jgi:hypothetical protein